MKDAWVTFAAAALKETAGWSAENWLQRRRAHAATLADAMMAELDTRTGGARLQQLAGFLRIDISFLRGPTGSITRDAENARLADSMQKHLDELLGALAAAEPEAAEPEWTWGKVEIFGHRVHWGRYRWIGVDRFLDVEELDDPSEFTRHRYGAKAIFAVHELTEAEVREALSPPPPPARIDDRRALARPPMGSEPPRDDSDRDTDPPSSDGLLMPY